jgi:GAF domain-containing protein
LVPLATKDNPIGFIILCTTEVEAFTTEHSQITAQLASQLAIALQQAQLFETTQRQLEELRVLHAITLAGAESTSVDQLLGFATDIISGTLYTDAFAIGLVDEDAGLLRFHTPYQSKEEIAYYPAIPLGEGVAGKVLESGEPRRISDIRQISEYFGNPELMRSELTVPLKIGERVIGVINTESMEVAAFTEEDERLLITIAGQLATAIEKLQLFDATQRQIEELSVLRAIAVAGAEASNISELLDRATDIIGNTLYTDSFAIGLIDEDHHRIRFHAPFQPKKGFSYFSAVPLGKGVASQVIESGEARRIPDVREVPEYLGDYEPIRSELMVPLKVGDQVIGVINAESVQVNNFTDKDERLLTTIAGQLATAIEKTQLFEAEQVARQTAETLQAANQALTQSLDLKIVLDTMLHYLHQLIPYDSANVMLLEGETHMVIRATRGYEQWAEEDPLHRLAFEVQENKIFSTIVNSHNSILVNDTAKHPDWEQTEEGKHAKNWIGVPLMAGGKCIGLFGLDKAETDFFTEEHLRLAEALAAQAAVAIENAHLFEQTLHRTRELETLTHISTVLRSTGKYKNMLSSLLELTESLLDADIGIILFQEGSQLELAAVRGLENTQECLQSHELTNERLWEAIQSAHPLFFAEEPAGSCFDDRINSTAFLPLQTSEGIVGIMLLAWSQHAEFTDEECRLLAAIADIAGNALDRARVMETLEHQVSVRTRDLSVLYEVTAIASEHRDLNMMLDKSLEKILESVGSEIGAIHILNDKRNEFELIAQRGMPPETAAQIAIMAEDNALTRLIIDQDQPLIIEDIRTDPRVPLPIHSLNCQAYIGVPICTRGETCGVISIFLETIQQFATNYVNLLITLADQLANAIERAQLRERAEQAIIIQERQRLARELHDAMTQSLYSLTLMADAARKFSDEKKWARSEHYLRLVGDTAQQVLKEMRMLVYELRPSALEREGLVEVLRQRLETVEKRAGVETKLLVDQSVEPSVEVQVALYRIAQEALNNALKHAVATSVEIRFYANENHVELEISDNGRGFDPEHTSSGFGLISMEERAKSLGASFEVISSPGEGTRIFVQVEEENNE